MVRAPPVGLGYPVFDKLEAELAKALMSLPATKARPPLTALRFYVILISLGQPANLSWRRSWPRR